MQRMEGHSAFNGHLQTVGNAERDIEINSIAVGGSFQILEWLAEDSGGTHVRYD